MFVLIENDIIIAFDPGGTTGVVVVEYTSDRSFDVLYVFEIPWSHRFTTTDDILRRLKVTGKRIIVIIEDFSIWEEEKDSFVGDPLPAPKMIGIIECSCYYQGIDKENIIIQQPGVKSRVAILDRHYHLFRGSEHCKDAYQHARYLITQSAARKKRT